MLYVLYTLFFVACVILVASVLLQPGKTDAGALFTSNISNTAFGPRGTASILAKITIVAAVVFMLSALMISMPALQGGVSVLQTVGETPAETAPAETNVNAVIEPVDSNIAPAANVNEPAANSEPTANANSNENR